MSKKSSVPTKRFRDYEVSGRNRCQQPWASKNFQSTCYNATVCKFIRIRKYLNIDTEVEIGGEDSNVELHNSYCYTKKVKNTRSSNYQVDIHKEYTHSNSLNDGVSRIFSDVSSDTITPSNIRNESEAHHFSDVSNDTITQSNIPNDSEAHNSSIHPPRSSSTHDEPVVTTTLAPNPPTVSCPVAEPREKLQGKHFEQISKSALSWLRNKAKVVNKIRQKMQAKKYVGSPLGDRLIGSAMMHTP